MKAYIILGHPLVLIGIFLLLIIEGNHFGGFYLLYLLLALPHAALYALLAVAGILLIILGNKVVKKTSKIIMLSLGLSMMLLSLVVFFGRGDDKTGTFEQFIPLASFCLFGVSMICFIINSWQNFSEVEKKRSLI